jgi:hypothetical protein
MAHPENDSYMTGELDPEEYAAFLAETMQQEIPADERDYAITEDEYRDMLRDIGGEG